MMTHKERVTAQIRHQETDFIPYTLGFDARTGATISARAVVGAVGRATAWAAAHRQALFAAPAGSTLQGETQ